MFALTWWLGQVSHRCCYTSILVSSLLLLQQCCLAQLKAVVVVWGQSNCNIVDEHHLQFLVLLYDTQIVHYHDYMMHLLFSNHRCLYLVDNRLCLWVFVWINEWDGKGSKKNYELIIMSIIHCGWKFQYYTRMKHTWELRAILSILIFYKRKFGIFVSVHSSVHCVCMRGGWC